MSRTTALRAEPYEAHTVRSHDGVEIRYDLYDSSSEAAVLVVPGFWRDRRHPSMLRLVALLDRFGYRPAVCDIRGHGDSGGRFGFNRDEHYDVAAVVQDLLGRARPRSLSVVALSYGASLVISGVARHDLPIASLVAISPVADLAMVAPRLNPFTMHRHIAFSQALRRPRFDLMPQRKGTIRAMDDVRDMHAPVCFIHVKNDWLIHHRHSLALYENANDPKELHVLDVEGHYHADRIFAIAPDVIEPIVSGFLARYA